MNFKDILIKYPLTAQALEYTWYDNSGDIRDYTAFHDLDYQIGITSDELLIIEFQLKSLTAGEFELMISGEREEVEILIKKKKLTKTDEFLCRLFDGPDSMVEHSELLKENI